MRDLCQAFSQKKVLIERIFFSHFWGEHDTLTA
jgi:hypothetical protein